MEETEKGIGATIGGVIGKIGGGVAVGGLVLLFAAISYFTLGGLPGFFGVMILGILFGFCTLLALIPFGLGLGAQIPVMLLVVQPWVCQLSGIHTTGLTWTLFAIDVAVGVFLNIIASVGLVMLIKKIFN